MYIYWKELLASYGIFLPLLAIIWYLLSLFKNKVFIRWLIQVLIFLILSITITVLGIIIFLVKAEPMNIFWFGITFRIGFNCFVAFLFSTYFLITRGIIFPKRKKKAHEKFREELKKHGFEERQIDSLLKYDD